MKNSARIRALVTIAALFALAIGRVAGLAENTAPATPAQNSTVAPISAPRFTHPGAGQVFYFVLTDRFANGDATNDTGGIAGGADVSGFDPSRISHYHGGDFAGLTAKLDYIKHLGATAVWVTPPFRNKAMQNGTAGYHGYWILDFEHVDSHLGTEAEFREFIAQAHARSLKVYLDIVVNHTADVIQYRGGHTDYIPITTAPYRDASGRPFDERAVAFNGLNSDAAFPVLSAERSFAYVPFVPPADAQAKNPAWLNDVTMYHNRGNSTFAGESALDGDFSGLDDVFTEKPAVVRGFIDLYAHWIETFGVDGFRIDTVRHVNREFWQTFAPAIRERARRAGRPDFLQFGEVADGTGDTSFISEFSTTAPLDATLDFGFFGAALDFVSHGKSAAQLAEFFAKDDYYTDHDSNVHSTTTFLGNHDAGRFAYFLQHDNPSAPREQIAALVKFGYGLLFLVRGQPVIYYGDEQGMIGGGGGDMQAREDMFAAQAPDFKNAKLLGTMRTGADDKFDEHHPLYETIRALATLRTKHPALSRGAMIIRPTDHPNLFAFSRIERGELIEYLCGFNNSRAERATAVVATSQPAGAILRRLYDSAETAAFAHENYSSSPSAESLTVDAHGNVTITLERLQFAVWRAAAALASPANGPGITFATPKSGAVLSFPTHERDGHLLVARQELRADVTGGDGANEVTFVMARASRPGQYELLGTDDAAPYRIFWRPPPDLAPGEELAFIATVDDLRGHRAATQIDKLKLDGPAIVSLAANTPAFGVHGATVPSFEETPPSIIKISAGTAVTLRARAQGTAPLYYQWLHNGTEISGASKATFVIPPVATSTSGRYSVIVRNVAGAALSAETVVSIVPGMASRLETQPSLASRFVMARRVDVWLPPGYDADETARYPVVYMHDGQNLFDPSTSYAGTPWEVDQPLSRLIQAGKMRGAIVVGIWNTPLRYAEYMPQKAVATKDIKDVSGTFRQRSNPIQSDNYLKFIVEELKPFVDRGYRTEPDRAHTFIAGSSMGGLISAYAVVEYPEVFGGAACISTHWPAGDGAVIDYLARHLPSPATHRFYFDYGTATLDRDYEPYQLRMDAVMRRAGYVEGASWLTRKFPGADHSEKSWRARVEVPLLFLLGR